MDFLNVLPLVVAESNAGAAIGVLIGGLIGLACSLVVLVAYWKLFVKMLHYSHSQHMGPLQACLR